MLLAGGEHGAPQLLRLTVDSQAGHLDTIGSFFNHAEPEGWHGMPLQGCKLGEKQG